MKKSLLLLLVISLGLLSMSCDETASADPVNPAVRFYIDPTLGTTYGALGTYSIDTEQFTTESSWVSADGGNYTSYTSVSAGSYTVLKDTDSDHSRATVWTTYSYNFENDKKYTISFTAAGSFVLAIDN
ncbi:MULTISPECIES: hypothetical protein [unclassified Oceanispirochaeta]|uniref:hypothetical protein n=1 Tax=unclassified Oceanispirochaeta TaxID=2635722 RepID=UPI000E09292F|nr:MULTISPECIES: hypothetical protein [unclassified Oceanispirochaeta]MBF9014703.1 hypothetical protein [Oceanispirochaeta sp. M2]NPD70959.1 hypothetical protein [Oceanispirochaeta sp. M1]RDG33792.1 hypothetical protein DV872_02505 [Oceanispirochaeta sp. M1]